MPGFLNTFNGRLELVSTHPKSSDFIQNKLTFDTIPEPVHSPRTSTERNSPPERPLHLTTNLTENKNSIKLSDNVYILPLNKEKMFIISKINNKN